MLKPEKKIQNHFTQNAKELRKEKNDLVSKFFKKKVSVPYFLKQHTRILDDYFHKTHEASSVDPKIGINKDPYALIAVGGYGRQNS